MLKFFPKWSKMVQNSTTWSKMIQQIINCFKIVSNGLKRSTMIPNFPKMFQNDPTWFNGLEWFNMVQNLSTK